MEELLKRHTYLLESGLNSDPTLAQRELRLMGQSPMQTISPRLALLGFASLFTDLVLMEPRAELPCSRSLCALG